MVSVLPTTVIRRGAYFFTTDEAGPMLGEIPKPHNIEVTITMTGVTLLFQAKNRTGMVRSLEDNAGKVATVALRCKDDQGNIVSVAGTITDKPTGKFEFSPSSVALSKQPYEAQIRLTWTSGGTQHEEWTQPFSLNVRDAN